MNLMGMLEMWFDIFGVMIFFVFFMVVVVMVMDFYIVDVGFGVLLCYDFVFDVMVVI